MKKTMFITSVIMVVVMAIALTTSSLAWFTANGSNTIVSNTMTITAAVSTSEGIQVSKVLADRLFSWEPALNLDAQAGALKPLVPLADDEEPNQALLLAALAGDSFIGANIGSNGNFTGLLGDDEGASTAYTDGYYQDEFWVTNIATGASAADVTVSASIAFKDATTGNAYSPNSADPVLWVAVLAQDKEVVPYVTGYNANAALATQYDDDDDAEWEVIAIASSKAGTAVNVGKEATNFAPGAKVQGADGAYSSVSLTNFAEDTSTVVLAAISGEASDTYENEGGIGHFKVLAWYDGASLIAQNSGFAVSFVITLEAEEASD